MVTPSRPPRSAPWSTTTFRRPRPTAQAADQLAVATYNVENLDPADPADKFDRLAQGVVTNLASPDVVALEEIQDNNGATNNGVVAADATLNQLTAAIKTAGGPAYEWIQINPVNGQDGGEPGGNIRSVFLTTPRGSASRRGRPAARPTRSRSRPAPTAPPR